jgi:hypothetical protein
MKTAIALTLILFCSACAHHAPPATPKPIPAPWNAEAAMKSIVGTWVVDLRGSPADAPYTQPFVVTAIDETGRSISGRFYGSDISWSRLNTAWGKVVITFITSDGQGEYTHTAVLEGETLVGTSSAKHRNLLVPWTARREAR